MNLTPSSPDLRQPSPHSYNRGANEDENNFSFSKGLVRREYQPSTTCPQ